MELRINLGSEFQKLLLTGPVMSDEQFKQFYILRGGEPMQDFSIKSLGEQIIITVDRSLMSLESLNRLFERMRIEQLVKKANFRDEVVDIGNEIKRDWWQKNREQYLEGISDADRD